MSHEIKVHRREVLMEKDISLPMEKSLGNPLRFYMMWMEEEEGWIMEEKRRMDRDGGFPLFEKLRLWMYSIENSESRLKFTRPRAKHALMGLAGMTIVATTWLSEYDGDHVLSMIFTLSMPLGFFMGLLHAKLELAAKRENTLGLSCVLSELSQSSTFSR
ncbi:hypothetical protein HKD37_16G045692 [Glycine soja]